MNIIWYIAELWSLKIFRKDETTYLTSEVKHTVKYGMLYYLIL
jgi:hypothetical protein